MVSEGMHKEPLNIGIQCAYVWNYIALTSCLKTNKRPEEKLEENINISTVYFKQVIVVSTNHVIGLLEKYYIMSLDLFLRHLKIYLSGCEI